MDGSRVRMLRGHQRSGGERSAGRVELLVSCRDLADLDVFTKSDPMCVLFVRQFGQWSEFGRTEAIRSTLNPKFVESFILEYDDSVQQALMFSVYDIDSRSNDLRQHDFVGSVEVRLADLMDDTRTMLTTTRTLRVPGDPKSRGTLCVTSEVLRNTRSKVQMHVVGHKLEKIGFLQRKPDTFLEVGRSIDSITFHPVFRTEVQPKTRHPWWRPFELTVQRLCNDDWDRPLQFSTWHVKSTGRPGSTFEMIGKVTTTLREMSQLKYDGHYRKLHVICPKKEKSKKKDTVAGTLRFYQFRVDMQYSLLDYIRGGMQLRLLIAIDFTSSNGDITDPSSLHNTQERKANQYLRVMEVMGGALCRYDLQQRVALFGFGAKRQGETTPNHCFPLPASTDSSPWVNGIKGAEEAYHSVLPTLTMAGPTYLSPVLRKAMDLVPRDVTQDLQHYYVLLVITDGIINDIDRTVELLVEASSLPLSVIVTGVGPTNFVLTEQFSQSLHAPLFDEQRKKRALRNNTHFSAFKKDAMSTGGGLHMVQEALASLSAQVLDFMKMRSLSPGKPRNARMDPANSWISPNAPLSRVGVGSGVREDDDQQVPVSDEELFQVFKVPESSSGSFHRSSVKLKDNAGGVIPRTVSTPALNASLRRSVCNLSGPVCPTCGSTISLDMTT